MLIEPVDAALMNAAGPGLRVIANYAAGHDNIDLDAARARDIAVTTTPDVLTLATAEHTLALMLALTRRVAEKDRFLRPPRRELALEADIHARYRARG